MQVSPFQASALSRNKQAQFSQTRPTAQPPVRFGWFSLGHQAIDKGATYRLPENDALEKSWKDYLLSHNLEIEAGNDMQDILYNGPNHFINLEKRGNPQDDEPVNGKKLPLLAWDTIKTKLSQPELRTIEKEWLNEPLEPESILPGESVYSAILKSYDLVKSHLQKISQGDPQLNQVTKGERRDQVKETRETYYEELARNIGRLNHYVGDMFIPFHVSPGTPNWELMPGSDKGIHLFVEGDILNGKDYSTLVEQAKQRSMIPMPLLTRETLPYFILNKMKDSFRKLYEIVDIQKAALADENVNTDSETFEKALAQRLKFLVNDQAREAQEAVSTILHAVWQEAGRPTIPGPEKQASPPPLPEAEVISPPPPQPKGRRKDRPVDPKDAPPMPMV